MCVIGVKRDNFSVCTCACVRISTWVQVRVDAASFVEL